MEVLCTIGQIEVLLPECNLDTLKDGRGGIFSWVPDHDIKEFNLVIIKPNKVRGNHYHPEFVEYFLVVKGQVFLSTCDTTTGKDVHYLASSGMCFRTPIGISHSFHAIEESYCVSLLTKPWDLCDPPIVSSHVF